MSIVRNKTSLQTQRQLLHYLADGRFYSGQWLAEQLGFSRTAIANFMAQLQSYGLDIFSVKGKGYRLAQPLQLLDAAKIKALQQQGAAPVWIQHITDSTNSQLLQRISQATPLAAGTAIVAEAQTAGRGRRGRQWYSPFGCNLYFSMYWRLEQGVQAAMGLSLVVGVVLCRILRESYKVPAKVKWPNDIYVEGKKMAGILVELAGQVNAGCDVVIGIGVNLSMPSDTRQYVDQAFTDLATESSVEVDRNELVAGLHQALTEQMQRFSTEGFASFVEDFNHYDAFAGQQVQLSGTMSVQGICRGVDSQGGLIIEIDGQPEVFYGGEISLRPGV